MFIHNLLNVLVEIANKTRLQKNCFTNPNYRGLTLLSTVFQQVCSYYTSTTRTCNYRQRQAKIKKMFWIVSTCRSQENLLKPNFVAWVRDRTIPTKRPPLVGEVSANFCGYTVPRGHHDGSLRLYSRLSRPEPLLFLPSSCSSVVIRRLSGPRSRPTTS
jgi:hypothetical protein